MTIVSIIKLGLVLAIVITVSGLPIAADKKEKTK